MRKLLIFAMLFCGTQVALGQRVIVQPTASGCGFERDTDLDGTYTSSTSTDQCSTYSASAQGMSFSSVPLVESSYRLSQMLNGQDRLIYLVELCRSSALPVGMAKEVALTLFHVATTERSTKSRAVGQKNAAACLSYIDPVAAMELLLKVNFEPPQGREWLYEDPRYNAAETIFINFMKLTPIRISSIADKARYLGRTGQYPYVAIARVIQHLATSERTAANALVSDALSFYSSETGFYNRDEEFLRFLQVLNGSLVDRDLIRQAVVTFVRRLKSDPILLPGDYYAEIHIASTRKVFPFTDRNEAFLFQAFPQIRRFNPALAAQLHQQDPRLEQANENMSYISGGFFQGDPTSEQATEQHLQWLQQALLRRIKEYQDSNPQAALALAQRLTDVSSRILGFSATIPGIARTNPSAARNLYEGQRSDLGNLSDSVGRLQAMVALAPAAYHLGDSSKYQLLSEQALETGARFFRNDDDTDRVQNRRGFAELRDLIAFTASQPTDILQTKVQQMPDDWLKAYLLLYEAQGRAKQSSSSAVPTKCPE